MDQGETRMKNRWVPRLFSACFIAGLLSAGPALAIPGRILKTDGGSLEGDIKWQPASKQYMVTTKQGSLYVPVAQKMQVIVAPPAGLDAALKQVQSGAGAGAISTLEKIRTEYNMMGPDVQAARGLAQAYMQMKDPDKALAMCKAVLRDNPEAASSGEFAGIYWDILNAKNMDSQLDEELGKAIQSGDREVAAVAQIKRGDIKQKQGNLKEALVDGYLRTVLLFEEIKFAQPEALYKATKCFEQLGQQSHADKFRKRLLADYPDDPWAQKLRAGGGS
jgi:tetratricopeptide (TPR) repeat protein